MAVALNDKMEFHHVVQVHADGSVTDGPAGLYAPEVYVELDADGQMVSLNPNDIQIDKGWTLLNGYSGQDRYRGPIMHDSEYIGGGMERDILAEPGIYVAVTVIGLRPRGEQRDDDLVGWAVARRRD
jgi:hypothetical protein